MNYADFFTTPGGFPLEADATLGFMQTDYQSAIKALGKLAGSNNIILTGLVITGGVASDGWILLNNDVVFFQGGTVQTNFIITEVVVSKNNQNGLSVPRYTTKKAVFGSGTGAIAFSTLVRVEALSGLTAYLKIALNPGFEDGGVLLSGFGIVEDTPTPGECQIGSGLALVGSTFLSVSSYSGPHPVYLKEDGTYTTTEPVSGSFIEFDPFPSQYLLDVIKRASAHFGEVRQIAYASVVNFFDNTGLGKFGYKGWALCNGANGTVDLRGRFVVGYDPRLIDPANGIWDADYNTIGTTGGEKAHELTVEELPDPGTDLSGYGLIRKSLVGENVTVDGSNTGGSGTEPDVTTMPADYPYSAANSDPHENRPPYIVLAYIQRII